MDEGPLHISRAVQLTRPQKVAVIVRLLLGEGVELDLAALPAHVQEELTLQLAQMRSVDHLTLAAVAAEFAEAVDSIGLTFRPGVAGALGTLGKSISPTTAERLRRRLGVDALGDPWERVAELSTEALLPLLKSESIEVGAVILSKLSVARAADVMRQLPGPHARRLAYAMSSTAAVNPDLVAQIGRSILEQIDSRPVRAFHDGPVKRVGAILNAAPSATRDDVLEGLDETDRAFADEVRRAIFTFANIPDRVEARDISKLVRAADPPMLVKALAGAEQQGLEAPVAFILANMSQRLAAQIREDIEALGRLRAKEADQAMADMVALIRDMEQRGELLLTSAEE